MNIVNKFCKNCGCPLKDEDRFCKNCGTAVCNQQQMHNQESNSFHQPMNNQSMGMNNRVDNKQNSIPYNKPNNMAYNKTNNNYNSYQNNSNSNVKWKDAAVGIILLILIGAGAYLLLNMDGNTPINTGGNSSSTNNNSNNTTNNNSSNSASDTTNDNSNNSSNNETSDNSYAGNTQSSTTKSVYFKGFTFKVPTSYVYEIDGDTLSFEVNEDTWYVGVQVLTGEYSSLISNKKQVIAGIEEYGYKINTYNQKKYSGMECITMEVNGLGQKMLMSYVKANSSKIFVVSVVNPYNDYDYSLFEDIIKVLKTGV